jgi:hypothetical protein
LFLPPCWISHSRHKICNCFTENLSKSSILNSYSDYCYQVLLYYAICTRSAYLISKGFQLLSSDPGRLEHDWSSYSSSEFFAPNFSSLLPTDTTSVVGSSTSDELFVQAQSHRCHQFVMFYYFSCCPAVGRVTQRYRSLCVAGYFVSITVAPVSKGQATDIREDWFCDQSIFRQTSRSAFAPRLPTLLQLLYETKHFAYTVDQKGPRRQFL